MTKVLLFPLFIPGCGVQCRIHEGPWTAGLSFWFLRWLAVGGHTGTGTSLCAVLQSYANLNSLFWGPGCPGDGQGPHPQPLLYLT